MPQGAAGVPACFVCVMLLVTAPLDRIQRSLEDAIGPDDSRINCVATLAAFLARLRPHKSELSPSKPRSYPREFNSWAMSSLRMVSVLTMTKSPPCRACVCLRTPNSSAVYLMVLVTISSPCLTWLGANARLRSYSSHKKNFIYALLAPNRSSLFSVLDAVFKYSRPFYLLCDANTNGLGVTLEQKQPDGSICLMVYIRRSILRQSAELDSYNTRSGMRCVEYPTPSPLFIQRVLHNLHGPRVP